MLVSNKIRRYCRNLFRGREIEHTLDAELGSYLEELTARNIRNGVCREEARRHALAETGSIEQIKEDVRETWLGQGIGTALQDVRYALRSLLRAPGFTAVVIATLSLGIGASLTMFSLMRAVLWRPLPYPEPNRIVVLQVDARNTFNTGATMGEVRDLRERSRSMQQVSIISAVDANLEYAGETEHVAAASVSDDFLRLLGARPALGRVLESRIDEGKEQVLAILISDELWRRRFSADPGVIGRSVRVNNLEMRVAGVLCPGFRLFMPPSVHATEQIDVWFPYSIGVSGLPYRGLPVVARLRPGITLAQANAEFETLVPQFAKAYPEAYVGGKARITARLLHDELTREARPALFLLSAAVAFVLLIACVNVANLLFARGAVRQRELEIRRALGAERIRIVRQLLTESLVLASASAGIGLLGAHFGLDAFGRLSATHLPLQSRVGMDASVALSAVALSVLTSILFGLLPAWRLASGGAGQALRAGRAETAGAGARRLQRTLVVAEVALSIAPLACGGLMLRSFLNLLHAPLGFDPANVVTAKVPFSLRKYANLEQRWAFVRDVLGRVRAIPEVQSVSAASPLPLADQDLRRVGRADQPDAPILATQQVTTPGYLNAIGTPLRVGHDFTEEDIAAERNVTIIDERLAKRLWPEGAIGKHLSVYRTGRRDDIEIIGVTAAVRATQVRDDSIPHFMIPYSLYPVELSLVVKTREPAERMAPWIKSAVDAAQGGRAAFDIRPMSAYVSDSIGDTRFILVLLAAFAGASVLLAAVGLYGTLAYLTAQRTREFGIRLALGSSANAIVAIVVRESVWLAAAGAAVGLVGVAAVTGVIKGLLYGVRPLDSTTLTAVAGLVGFVALGAAIAPAWRAARTDPQTSLRSE
jgi:predicted permease